jgi:tRNA threonylcarbamoyladenosine biosynthesis protein TsaB
VRVLAVDTSTELGSVAVLVDGELRAEIAARVRARHGETLLPLIAQALDHAGLERDELDLLAVGVGPGSFTGTRIGVATAKGLAIALDRPLMGVVSLSAIARAMPGRRVVPIVDAHKGEVYLSVHEREGERVVETLAPIHAAPLEAARQVRAAIGSEPLVLGGSGLRRYPEIAGALAPADVLPALWDAPRAAMIALEAEARFVAQGPDDRAALEPLYVRPSDAVLPGDRSP